MSAIPRRTTYSVYSTVRESDNVLISEILGSHGCEEEGERLLVCRLYSLLEIDEPFRGAYCLHHPGADIQTGR
jgi:hypothetical protein